jgi:CheY-like chemotaxis protein
MVDPQPGVPSVLIFENDPRQAIAYRDLFSDAAFVAKTALPNQDVERICQEVAPDAVLFDMAIWEADTAYVFGVLNNPSGFTRPVILALASLPHQVRRAKKFGADAVWVRGVDDAAALPELVTDLLSQREQGTLKLRTPSTPL